MSLEPRFGAFDADVGFPQLSSASYPKLRFKNASRPMELESGWNGPGRCHRERMICEFRASLGVFEDGLKAVL